MQIAYRARIMHGYDLKDLINSKGRTIAEAGVDKVTIHRLSGGQQRPNPKTLRKIAECIGVTVEEVFAAWMESKRRAHDGQSSGQAAP